MVYLIPSDRLLQTLHHLSSYTNISTPSSAVPTKPVLGLNKLLFNIKQTVETATACTQQCWHKMQMARSQPWLALPRCALQLIGLLNQLMHVLAAL